MKLTLRPLTDPNDYFRVRNFLREVFLLNDRLEHSWNVARLDYWRWHFIATCQFTAPFEQVAVAYDRYESDGYLDQGITHSRKTTNFQTHPISRPAYRDWPSHRRADCHYPRPVDGITAGLDVPRHVFHPDVFCAGLLH